MTYWDYIQTDALLNLQVQRTTLPDEMVFIMYHQINELLFKRSKSKTARTVGEITTYFQPPYSALHVNVTE